MAIDIYAQLQDKVDGVTTTYLDQNLDHVVDALSDPLKAGMLIYVAGCGYLMLTGRTNEPVKTVLAHLFKVVTVATICLHIAEYRFWVVDLAQHGIPDFFAQAFDLHGQAPFDAIVNKTSDIAAQLYARGGMTAIGYIIAAYVIIAVGTISTVIGFLIGVMADFMLAVLLAVGPIFIALSLFEATKPFFEKWTAFLVNFVLVKILLVLILSLFLGLFQGYVDQVLLAMAGHNDGFGDAANLSAMLLQMTVYAVVIGFLTLQVPSFASSLAGSVALGAHQAINAMRGVAGVAPSLAVLAATRGSGWARSGLSTARQAMTPRNTIAKG